MRDVNPPKYILTYFNARGRAEISRLIFAAANVDYTDNRIDDWPCGRDETPLGQLPYLTVDGVKIPQSISIARYLAREFRMEGKDYITQAKCDGIVDTCLDFQRDLYKIMAIPDEIDRTQATKEFFGRGALDHASKLETLIHLYGSAGHSVGNQLTWADLMVFDIACAVIKYERGIFSGFGGIQRVIHTVESHPRIARYLRERPNASF